MQQSRIHENAVSRIAICANCTANGRTDDEAGVGCRNGGAVLPPRRAAPSLPSLRNGAMSILHILFGNNLKPKSSLARQTLDTHKKCTYNLHTVNSNVTANVLIPFPYTRQSIRTIAETYAAFTLLDLDVFIICPWRSSCDSSGHHP